MPPQNNYPQQYPQQQPQYQQYDGYQPPNQKSGPNIKLIALIGGGILLFLLGISIYAASQDSNNTVSSNDDESTNLSIEDSNLTEYVGEDADFSIGMPADWDVIEYESVESFNVLATPKDKSSTDRTEITVAHPNEKVDAEDFIRQVENNMGLIADKEYQATAEATISNIDYENYGTETEPSFKATYETSYRDGASSKTTVYFVRQSDGTTVTGTFTYSEKYGDIENRAAAIMQTYNPN